MSSGKFIAKRQGTLRIMGKRNRVQKVPLNATARAALSSSEETLTLNPEDDTTLPKTIIHTR